MIGPGTAAVSPAGPGRAVPPDQPITRPAGGPGHRAAMTRDSEPRLSDPGFRLGALARHGRNSVTGGQAPGQA